MEILSSFTFNYSRHSETIQVSLIFETKIFFNEISDTPLKVQALPLWKLTMVLLQIKPKNMVTIVKPW